MGEVEGERRAAVESQVATERDRAGLGDPERSAILNSHQARAKIHPWNELKCRAGFDGERIVFAVCSYGVIGDDLAGTSNDVRSVAATNNCTRRSSGVCTKRNHVPRRIQRKRPPVDNRGRNREVRSRSN